MPRKKPASAKQRKAELQLKRAIKRGDAPTPEPKERKTRTSRKGPINRPIGSGGPSQAAESTRKLQSDFIRLPKQFLEETRDLCASIPLARPIPPDACDLRPLISETEGLRLSCPIRPKWRFDMSKKEVEKNEEGLFKKWTAQVDQSIDEWLHHSTSEITDEQSTNTDKIETNVENTQQQQEQQTMPKSPTFYERNLEVWRQLWRVTEISQIILVLLDARCPLLHFPTSLVEFLSASGRPFILVLSKVDIIGPVRAAAWSDYLRTRYPHSRVVQIRSYVPKAREETTQGTKRRYEPSLPGEFRAQLVEAIRSVHAELVQPPSPPPVYDEANKGKKPKEPRKRQFTPKLKVKQTVDWNAVMQPIGEQVGVAVGGAAVPKSNDESKEEEDEDEDEEREPEFLTIGLIGQPNVGKSSLLNALFGKSKVRASKTPGKTKHFQTLFWTPEVRLMDCPGLVLPGFVHMETQVLSGILPISRISAIPLCIYHASQLLPLERILGLQHPSLSTPVLEDKRTWREPREPLAGGAAKTKEPVWTAMDILTAYATKVGWMTAKAGRPDTNRAGNAILRALAEGRIKWAFLPPGTVAKELGLPEEDGIYIADDDPHATYTNVHSFMEDDDDDEEEDEGAAHSDSPTDIGDDTPNNDIESDLDGDSDEENTPVKVPVSQGMFAALEMDDADDGESNDDDDDDEEKEEEEEEGKEVNEE